MPVTSYYTVNGEIIGERTTGQSRLDYLTDALGSVVATVDQTLTTKSTARYKPYGADLATTGVPVLYGYVGGPGYRKTGRPHAEAYVRQRTLSLIDGRWTTADPLWPSERCYSYCENNPVTVLDPSGLNPSSSCLGAAADWMAPHAGLMPGKSESRGMKFRRCQRMLEGQFVARQQLGWAQLCPGGIPEICEACSMLSGLPINCGSKCKNSPTGGDNNGSTESTVDWGNIAIGTSIMPYSGAGLVSKFNYPICENLCRLATSQTRSIFNKRLLDKTCVAACNALAQKGCKGLFKRCVALEYVQREQCLSFWTWNCKVEDL